jgi:hypothetical protein
MSVLLSLLPPKNHHPFFVSVMEIEYLQKQKLVGISCKVYADDLELAIKNYSGKQVDLTKGNVSLNNELLSAYFLKHVGLVIDGSSQLATFVGYEFEEDAVFVYLEIKYPSPPKQVLLNTDLLYDYNKSQVNLVHYIQNGERQSHKLSYPRKEVLFVIK